jgi:hypothetical protein
MCGDGRTALSKERLVLGVRPAELAGSNRRIAALDMSHGFAEALGLFSVL